MQSNWEEAHSTVLRECVEKGMSFAQAAKALNKQFGTAYTRSAAIGRARRMGFSTPQRADSGSVFAPPAKADARKINETRARVFVMPSAKPSVLERAAVLQLRCVAITPRHLSLIDLEDGDCRYPYGGDLDGDPITFCGHPRRDGSAYCVSHFHLTIEPE